MKLKQSMGWIVAWLTLKPYGSNLLCNDTAMWIFSVRLIMLVLILPECTSWGYVAWQVGGREFASVAAYFAVLAAFTLNWTLDGSIMMLNRDKLFSALRPGKPREGSRISEIKVFSLILGRMIMISAVLYSSSSFLVQAMYSKDIEAGLANVNRIRIEQKRQEILKPLNGREVELRKAITEKEHELTKEVQGRLLDGEKGCGPACAVLEEQLRSLRASLAKIESQEKSVQETFEHKTPAELDDLFHIQLLGDGMEARGQIVEQLKKNEGFKRTEWSIQGALFILFIGLLLLKLYQPPSVLLFYSAALQDLHKRYRDNALNHLLRDHETPTSRPGGMTPHEFAKWAEVIYLPLLDDERFRQQQTRLDEDYGRKKVELNRQESFVEAELEALTAKQRELAIQGMKLEKEMNHASAQANTLEADIANSEEEYNKLKGALSQQSIPVDAYAVILSRSEKLLHVMRQHSEERDCLKALFQDCTKQLAQHRFDQGRLAEYASRLREELKFARDEKMSFQRLHIEQMKALWMAQDEARANRSRPTWDEEIREKKAS